jgi:hypothetical protein
LHYRHTQIGYVIIAVFAVAVLITDVLMVIYGSGLLSLLVAVVLIIIGSLFATLTIDVHNGVLRASFGPGLIHKTVQLKDVDRCEPIQYPWYYGYGIRITPRGWLYNVSGTQGVALTLKSGRVIQFGTDQPDALCFAVNTWLKQQAQQAGQAQPAPPAQADQAQPAPPAEQDDNQA